MLEEGPSIGYALQIPAHQIWTAKCQVAANIASFRAEKKLTMEALADICGTSQPQISRVLSGNFKGTSLERLLSWWLALGHEFRLDLFEGKQND